jgi:hypothetical protein
MVAKQRTCLWPHGRPADLHLSLIVIDSVIVVINTVLEELLVGEHNEFVHRAVHILLSDTSKHFKAPSAISYYAGEHSAHVACMVM